MGTGDITSCVIHPGIGVARVGNSRTDYFIGPEVPGLSPIPPGGYKDASGAVKRQWARVCIFGLYPRPRGAEEITAAARPSTWDAHVGASQAAWCHPARRAGAPHGSPP